MKPTRRSKQHRPARRTIHSMIDHYRLREPTFVPGLGIYAGWENRFRADRQKRNGRWAADWAIGGTRLHLGLDVSPIGQPWRFRCRRRPEVRTAWIRLDSCTIWTARAWLSVMLENSSRKAGASWREMQHPGESLKMLPPEFCDSGQGCSSGKAISSGSLPQSAICQAFDGFQRSCPDKPPIEFSCEKGLDLPGRVQVIYFHQARRVVFPEPLDQSGEFYIQVSPNKGEAEAARFFLAFVADRPGGMVNVTKNGPRILQETGPRMGQSNPMGAAGEDFGSELFLQRLNLAGERRLGEMKLPGRLGKAEVIRDGNEAFEFAHADPAHAKSVIYSCDHSNFPVLKTCENRLCRKRKALERDTSGQTSNVGDCCRGIRGTTQRSDRSKMKILIVDDNAADRELTGSMLKAAGHAILEASDGVEGLEVLQRESVDVIISDILMPRMDGYRFCYEVRARRAVPSSCRSSSSPVTRHRTTETRAGNGSGPFRDQVQYRLGTYPGVAGASRRGREPSHCRSSPRTS